MIFRYLTVISSRINFHIKKPTQKKPISIKAVMPLLIYIQTFPGTSHSASNILLNQVVVLGLGRFYNRKSPRIPCCSLLILITHTVLYLKDYTNDRIPQQKSANFTYIQIFPCNHVCMKKLISLRYTLELILIVSIFHLVILKFKRNISTYYQFYNGKIYWISMLRNNFSGYCIVHNINNTSFF